MKKKKKLKTQAACGGVTHVRETLGHMGDITRFRTNQLGSKDAADTPLHLLPLKQGEDFFRVERHVGHS